MGFLIYLVGSWRVYFRVFRFIFSYGVGNIGILDEEEGKKRVAGKRVGKVVV